MVTNVARKDSILLSACSIWGRTNISPTESITKSVYYEYSTPILIATNSSTQVKRLISNQLLTRWVSYNDYTECFIYLVGIFWTRATCLNCECYWQGPRSEWWCPISLPGEWWKCARNGCFQDRCNFRGGSNQEGFG